MESLDATVRWGRERRVAGFRHRVCWIILKFDPDHRHARALLKYRRRAKTDPWVQDPAYAEPPDWNAASVARGEERVADALSAYRDAVLDLLDRESQMPSARRETLLARLVELLPEDAVLQRRQGAVEHEGRWVLPETVEAEAARVRIAAAVESAMRVVKPRIRPDEEALAAEWATGFRTDRRRIFGTVDMLLGVEALLNLEVGDEFCAEMFEHEVGKAFPSTAILLRSREEARDVARRMDLDAGVLEEIDLVRGLPYSKHGILCYWEGEAFTRLAPLRYVIDQHLKSKVPGHDRGWIQEGLGQRIAWYVTSEHGHAFVTLEGTERIRGDDASGRTLPERATVWPRAAAAVLERDGAPRLRAVLTMRLNAMAAPDVLVAYGLAAYLVEARPKQLLPFLRASASSTDADAIVQDVLGTDLPFLAWRLRRWLLEVR